MTEETAAVVILNYNGRHWLEKFLARVVADSAPHEVIVADNASTDDSLRFLAEKFPHVRVIKNEGNYGYAGGYNEAVAHITSNFLIFLNNDVETTPGWIDRPLAMMKDDPTIGACQPLIEAYGEPGKFEYAGAAGGLIDRYGYPFCRGRLFNSLELNKGQYNGTAEIFWASGACMFIRKDAFERAGRFDATYFAHMEEIDLCWRMKNLGYRIMANGNSIVRHVGGGTLSKISARKTYLNFSNNLTTLAKNHRRSGLAAKLLARLVLDGIAGMKFILEGQPAHAIAVIRAHFSFYGRIGSIRKERRRMESLPGFRYTMDNVYNGLIVFEYYLRKKRTFSELKMGFGPSHK